MILVRLKEEVYTLLRAMPAPAPPPGRGTPEPPPGSLNDLLLLTLAPGAGLWDLGTRDLPRKGARDRDLGSAVSGGGAGLAKLPSSPESFLLVPPPIENLVIFLKVFFSMLVVFSWGDVFPDPDPEPELDLSEVLALELAVAELWSLLATAEAGLRPD